MAFFTRRENLFGLNFVFWLSSWWKMFRFSVGIGPFRPFQRLSICTPSPHRIRWRSSFLWMRGVIPSSAVSQTRSISHVKCCARWGEWITSKVSSLVCAADGDQLNEPVITFLLSITANLWCNLSPRARRGVPTACNCSSSEETAQGCSGLSWIHRLHKPEPKPEGHWIFFGTP
jgi:hypothetical protein